MYDGRVDIFSKMGEFIHQLGEGQMYWSYGITIHGDSVYVSCLSDYTIIKLSLTEMFYARRIGGDGSNNGQFKYLHQLTTDPIGRVIIADTNNNRICIHDPDLNHLYNITHQSIHQPWVVEVSRDRLYILCPYNNPCMHVLTLEGDLIHYLITFRNGMDVLHPHFFYIMEIIVLTNSPILAGDLITTYQCSQGWI